MCVFRIHSPDNGKFWSFRKPSIIKSRRFRILSRDSVSSSNETEFYQLPGDIPRMGPGTRQPRIWRESFRNSRIPFEIIDSVFGSFLLLTSKFGRFGRISPKRLSLSRLCAINFDCRHRQGHASKTCSHIIAMRWHKKTTWSFSFSSIFPVGYAYMWTWIFWYGNLFFIVMNILQKHIWSNIVGQTFEICFTGNVWLFGNVPIHCLASRIADQCS